MNKLKNNYEELFKNHLRKIIIFNIESSRLLEIFIVSAISTILAIRVFLELTGYPQLGSGGFHIAHMLWGGLLMLISIFILLTSLSYESKPFASFLGGIGFGAFIDELGKFITQDNNYFFQPTIAMLYIIFILLYMVFRYLAKERKYSDEELIINSLELLKEAVVKDLDEEEKQRALFLLSKLEKKDKIGKSVSFLLKNFNSIEKKPGLYTVVRDFFRKKYIGLVKKNNFRVTVIGFFIINSFLTLFQVSGIFNASRFMIISILLFSYTILLLIQNRHEWKNHINYIYLAVLVAFGFVIVDSLLKLEKPEISIIEWFELISSVVSAAIVMAGVLKIKESSLHAFRFFKTGILINIFLTQFFAFYIDQLIAVKGLALNIVILQVLNYAIRQEELSKK